MAGDTVAGAARLPRRVTTKDIALASGVSRATVSYVLNDFPGRTVSEATRELVLETARRLGHVPHGPARALRLGHSKIVVALVRDFTVGYVADRIIGELDRSLRERGFALLVHRFSPGEQSLAEVWGLLSPDLIVSMAGLPRPEEPAPNSPVRVLTVQGMFPHHRAGALQVSYLHGKGHVRLGYASVDNPGVEMIASERWGGAEAERVRLRLAPFRQHRFALGDVDAVFAAIDDWTGGPDPVTAVCAHNDEMALMISSALLARGLRAGRDLAVIGVDNIPLARVELTTVELNVEAYTRMIVEQVGRAVDGLEPLGTPDRDDYLRLVVRTSA